MGSEVFAIKNTVAFLENLVSLDAQVEIGSQVAHVK